ncbi:MAG TPA: hydrogenase/urease maturation nickel metallochaperone HypA [Gemmatimonadales bacterium]|jgi:Zn finger protein HypA/HybF involved in hydrogenase expression|nr:hydrogenase/urease maturation nickel metallochaperone HypA [Gemmatimonadales bacterium]
MHEMSVALEVCRMAGERLGSAADQLVALGVTVGDDAGVEPENLAFCLEALLAEPPFRGATPRILREPGDALHLSYLEVGDHGR